MSVAIPWWIHVLTWIIPLVVALVALAFQVKGKPRPALARKLFVGAGVLSVVAVEVSLLGISEALRLGLWSAVLLQLLALSIAANAWLALTARRFRALYADEEQRGWTGGLTYSTGELPPARMDKPHGVHVRVSSLEPIYSPIRLRFWFSGEVAADSLVWYEPDATRSSSREWEEAIASGAGSLTVGKNGRVDVEWAAADAVLNDQSVIVLSAYAAKPTVTLQLRSVQRRYRYSP